MNHPQGGDEVGREEQGEGRELPVQDKETARSGGDALGQAPHHPRPRVTKVEGWRIPERPAHTAVRVWISPLEIQGTARRLYPLRAPTKDLCTPAAWWTAQNV